MLCFTQTQGSISLLRRLLKTTTFLLASLPPSHPPSLGNHSYGSRKEEGGDSSCYARQHICSSLSNPWNLLELRHWSLLSGMQLPAWWRECLC